MRWKCWAAWGKRALCGLFFVTILAGCGGLGLSTPEPVELSFVYLEKVAEYQPLADEFHRQHPNITVVLKPVSDSRNGIRDLLQQAADADALRIPSMVLSDDLAKAVLPLDGLISTGDFPRDKLFPGTLEALRLDGKQLGLPAGINPFVMYYLPEKFAAAGLQPPQASWTLEDFTAAAVAIHKTDDSLIGTDRYAYGFCSHPQFADPALITYQFGGGLFDSQTQVTRPTLNQPANVEALSWYAGLKSEYGLMPGKQTREVAGLIFQHSCGFWIDWLDRSTFGTDPAPEAQPLPLPRHVTAFNIATIDAYFLLARTEHSEEAFQWIRFLMEQQAASGLYIPPFQEAVDSPEYAARVSKPMLAVARSLPEHILVLSTEMFRNDRFVQVLDLFSAAAQQVIDGESTPQFALDDAQRKAEGIFK